ncbi:MAG TPA: hypothetical protein VJ810_00625 [Blastocatellia bacterium]|nr:hypothetical protein [Blastocatellia bacterium]
MEKPLIALFLTLSLSLISQAQSPFQPIQSGYGANGPFAVTDEKFSSPLYDRENVHVFRPEGATSPAPVIFFAPGFANNDPREYEALINHVVSRGYALVYAPFQIVSGDITLHKKRYDTIFAGFEEAVKRYGSSFDLTRVGYAGHSYGAAAILNLSLRGLELGWGKDGLFLFVMAPWYHFEMSLSQFVNFPQHAKVIVQVYEQDGVCDHRVGKEIFERLNLPSSEKDFVMLLREERLGYKLEADHGTPSGSGQDAHDFYGVYRLLDALADYAFTGREEAKRVALGGGSAEQRFMGLWPDGKPVRELIAGDCATVTRSSLSFLFPYSPTTIGVANVSSASFKIETGLAPESLTSALGTNLSKYPLPNEEAIPPLKLNGTVVKVKDSACVERLAPLFFVAPTQVNYLLPAGMSNGLATITVFNEAGAISVGTAQINSVAPSLFGANSNGQGPAAASVLRVKPGGSQIYEPAVQFDTGLARYVTLPIDLSDPNDRVFLLLFGTGFRYHHSLASVSVTIGGVPVDVWYAGAQGSFFGLDQMNLLLPQTLAGRGEMDVVLKVEGHIANTVRIRVK